LGFIEAVQIPNYVRTPVPIAYNAKSNNGYSQLLVLGVRIVGFHQSICHRSHGRGRREEEKVGMKLG
jgi:hypothetical protein